MARVELYSTPTCPYCIMARALLRKKKVCFEEIDVANDPRKRDWLRTATGRHTVPQIFIGGTPVGGYDDLAELEAKGKLDALLAGT
ncbi:MAG: glutaredoxin 3 [Deltaproteobacteria bacterium]|nr:glutaredoxin 3 [Deltaproteobacteria bacterium]